MSVINELINKGSVQDRLNAYYENLCMESIKEGRGYGGFLSEAEKVALFESFSGQENERKAYNIHAEVYSKLTNILGKLGLLELELSCTATQLLWMKISSTQLEQLVENLNTLSSNLLTRQEFLQNPVNLLMGNLVMAKDGFFGIKYTEGRDLPFLILSVEATGKSQVQNLKTALFAVNNFIERKGFKSETYSEIINDIEAKCSISAETIGLIYPDIDIEKDYFEWFDSYFLR